jgi:hypothetical protein
MSSEQASNILAGPLFNSADASDPRQRLEHLRGHVKPLLMAQLRELYARSSCAALSSELEARLQQIDSYLVELGAALTPTAPGSEEHDGGLVICHEDSQTVTAEASLAYVPCNLDCVHGPFCAQVAAQVAARLLRSGERLSLLERITWQRPVRRKVSVEVSSGSLSGAAGSAVEGCLATSQGRQLQFRVRERPGEYVTAQTADNAIAQCLVHSAEARVVDGSWCLPLDLDRMSHAQRRALESPGVCLGTLLELVAILILNVRRGVPMLARGCTDLPLSAFGHGTSGRVELQLRCRRDTARLSPRSALLMVPYEFRYWPVMDAWATWVMAEATAGVEQMLRVLHERGDEAAA